MQESPNSQCPLCSAPLFDSACTNKNCCYANGLSNPGAQQVFQVRCGLCNQVVAQPFEDWKAKKPLPPHEALGATCPPVAQEGRYPVFKTYGGGMVMMSMEDVKYVLTKTELDEWERYYTPGVNALRDELLKALKKYGGK